MHYAGSLALCLLRLLVLSWSIVKHHVVEHVLHVFGVLSLLFLVPEMLFGLLLCHDFVLARLAKGAKHWSMVYLIL